MGRGMGFGQGSGVGYGGGYAQGYYAGQGPGPNPAGGNIPQSPVSNISQEPQKVVIPASGSDLDAMVDSRFGRAPFYILYDMQTGEFQANQNQAASAGGGAGTMAAQAVLGMGADTVISDNVGPNAFQVLAAAGIRLLKSVPGTVAQVIEKLKQGNLEVISAPGAYRHGG